MNPAIQRYLDKRTDLRRWSLETDATQGVDLVVVIPAFAEFPGLLQTLESVSAASPEALARALVIVVVNHREDAVPEEKENNSQALVALRSWSGALRLGLVDAAAQGHELLAKEGVGTARKAGLDLALSILAENGRESGGLVCLDADTTVDAGYLDSLHAFFAEPNRWAAVLEYAHPVAGDSAETEAILYYEMFLRYYELGLAWARSPFAFPAIGSAMGCTGMAYAAVSGMNRRCAGEDFYFLQQLAKTGVIQRVPGAIVRPASRPSRRVPFGTGRRVLEFLDNAETACRFYAPESFCVLRAWLEIADNGLESSGELLLKGAAQLNPALADFLTRQDFAATWTRLQKEHSGTRRMAAAFHTWFDGFRTLKLMHHLRDNGLADHTGFSAVCEILSWMGQALSPTPQLGALDAQRQLLEHMRKFGQEQQEWGMARRF